MSVPAKKGDHPKEPDTAKLSAFIAEVIAYVDDMTSTAFDMHFSEKVTFTCGACRQTIVRNSRLLKDGDIVQCQNSACDASYEARKDGEQFLFKPYLISLECKSCGEPIDTAANRLLSIPYDQARTVCYKCGARHRVVWGLQYAPTFRPRVRKQ